MDYVPNSQIEKWYGLPCRQEIVSIRIFGTDAPLNIKTHRLWLRLEDIFREHNPHYLKEDIKRDRNEWFYVCRPIAGTNAYSKHSWGIAGDLEASENNQGVLFFKTEIWRKGSESILQSEKEGFTWGGRFSNPDAMHWEVAVSPGWIRRRYHPNGKPRGWWARRLRKR